MNSFGVNPYVNMLYNDLCNGLVLFQVCSLISFVKLLSNNLNISPNIHAPDIYRTKCWERLTWSFNNVGNGFFVLDQCRVKFDSKQTLCRYQPNISIVLTVWGFCRVRLTGSHDKSPAWSCVLWKINPLKIFKTRQLCLPDLMRSECWQDVRTVWHVHYMASAFSTRMCALIGQIEVTWKSWNQMFPGWWTSWKLLTNRWTLLLRVTFEWGKS